MLLQPAFASADLQVASHPAGNEAAAAAAVASSNSQSSGSHPLLHPGPDDSSSSSQQPSSSTCNHALPDELLRLADASAPVSLPPPHTVPPGSLDNRELDKLVGTLGRNKATWRRALVLSQWLQESGHVLDDRLCTTVSSAGAGVLHGLLQAAWVLTCSGIRLLSWSAHSSVQQHGSQQ